MNELRYSILDALRAGPAQSHTVASRVGHRGDAVNSCLHRMTECGLVRRVTRGCYRIERRGAQVLAARDKRAAAIKAGTHRCCVQCNRAQGLCEFGPFVTCWTCRELRRAPPKPKPEIPTNAVMPAFARGHLSPILRLPEVA